MTAHALTRRRGRAATRAFARGRAQIAKRRVRSALVTLVLLLAAVVGTAIFAITGLYRSGENRYVKEAFPLRAATRDIVLQMVNQETGVRGYIITRDRKTLAPYIAGRNGVDRDRAIIRRLVETHPELRARFAAMQQQITHLHGFFDREITFVADGKIGEARARKDVLGGQKLFAHFRRSAAVMSAAIDQFVADTRAQQRRTFLSALAIVAFAGAGALAVAVFLLMRVPEDLRRRYAAEEQARARAEEGADAARALAHVDDAVVLLDNDNVVRSWNAAAERMFLVPAAEAVGRPAEASMPELQRVESAAERSGALVRLSVGGSEHWLAASVARFRRGRVLTLRDVTAERRLEQARADFVATASHELRTPLTSIYGAAQTLRSRADALPPYDRDRLLEMIEEEAERLAEIVEQILVTRQLDLDELRIIESDFDVRELCRSVLESAEARRPTNIALRLRTPDEPVVLHSDAVRLRQVLVNLVENAIKYSPGGGTVEVRVGGADGTVRVEVADEGLGIPSRELERIFDKFHRLDVDMTRGVGGSGLGLYISRQIAERLGGRISVRSKVGEGSTFAVELPRRAEGGGATGRSRPPHEPVN